MANNLELSTHQDLKVRIREYIIDSVHNNMFVVYEIPYFLYFRTDSFLKI